MLEAISMLLALVAVVPYAWHTFQGKTRPQLSSWILFFILNSLQGLVAGFDGAVSTALSARRWRWGLRL